MSFETNPRFLRDLLAEARAGRLQLPDFQRSYVWGDEDVRMLIASILRGFPVGALLTLRTGGAVAFRPRLLEGVEAARKAAGEGPAQAAEELLLDGQQRITSLFGALACPLSMTVRKPKSERRTLQRFYCPDIAKALDAGAELEDAILGQPEHRRRRDVITGQPADITTVAGDPMDVHHIFPRKWCEDRGIKPERYDSILNKTPRTAASNREIGGRAPLDHLKRIEAARGLRPAPMDEILRSHLIDPAFLRANELRGFLADRKRRLADLADLADLAARAMGLPLAAAAAAEEPEGDAMEDAA